MKRLITFDSIPLFDASVGDLNLKEFKEFLVDRKYAKDKKIKPEQALNAYSIVVDEHGHQYPSVAGLLLFGKDPQRFLSESFIICTRFAGIEGRDVIATRDATGTLFEQFHDAYDFIIKQLDTSFVIKGPQRTELLEIPAEAVRETLLNAIIHRDYAIKSPIKIAIYTNRIELFNPGGLPGPISQSNLKMGLSYYRNPIIAKIFREAGYVEKLGSGFTTIFGSYKKQKLKEPQVVEVEDFVKIILPRPTLRAMPSLLQEPEDAHAILDLFETANELTMHDILENTTLKRSTAARRLEELIKKNEIRKIGKGKGTRYVRN